MRVSNEQLSSVEHSKGRPESMAAVNSLHVENSSVVDPMPPLFDLCHWTFLDSSIRAV